tara:strand:- start:663 stop:1178 length:516 start_codon:yes stop_codon:yes gene_type:complete
MSTIYPIKYSFSGADCKAYGFFDDTGNVLLDSLATISLSIHESKSPVRRLGHMAPVGYTRAVRTIAGSMVLTIVGSKHPLRELSKLDPNSVTYYSMDSNNSSGRNGNIVTKMSPFNLMLTYQSELKDAPSSRMLIKGIDFINEGIVTSVNDLVSEVVLQFVALHVDQFGDE